MAAGKNVSIKAGSRRKESTRRTPLKVAPGSSTRHSSSSGPTSRRTSLENGTEKLKPFKDDEKIHVEQILRVSPTIDHTIDVSAEPLPYLSNGRRAQAKPTVLIPAFREVKPVEYCDLTESHKFVRRSERLLDRTDSETASIIPARYRNTPPRQAAQRSEQKRREADGLISDTRQERERVIGSGHSSRKVQSHSSSSDEESQSGATRMSQRRLFSNEEDDEDTEQQNNKNIASNCTSGRNGVPQKRTGTTVAEKNQTLKATRMSARRRLLGKSKPKPKEVITIDMTSDEADEEEESDEQDEAFSSDSSASDDEKHADDESSEESDIHVAQTRRRGRKPASSLSSSSDEEDDEDEDEDEEDDEDEEEDEDDEDEEEEGAEEEEEEDDDEETASEKEEVATRASLRNGRKRSLSSLKKTEEAPLKKKLLSKRERKRDNPNPKEPSEPRRASPRSRSASLSSVNQLEDDEEQHTYRGAIHPLKKPLKSTSSSSRTTMKADDDVIRHRISESFESPGKKRQRKEVLARSPLSSSIVPAKSPLRKPKAVKLLLSSFENDHRENLERIAETLGISVTEDVSDHACTHVIVPQPKRHVKCRRTMKVLAGLALGLPIVSEQWLLECQRKNRICSAAPYELNDIFPGVRQHRLRGGKGLLQGLVVHVMDQTMPEPSQLMLLITLAGGSIAQSLRSCDLCIGPEQSFRTVRKRKIRFLADSSFLDALQIGQLPTSDSMELSWNE